MITSKYTQKELDIRTEAIKETIERIITLVKTNKDPYMLPETEKRFISDIKSNYLINK